MGDKITELPWKVRSTLGHVSIWGEDNEMLVGWSVYPEKPYVNNAQFIVKAVNNHDMLVGLIQEFCDRVERGEVRSRRTYGKFKEALKNLENKNV